MRITKLFSLFDWIQIQYQSKKKSLHEIFYLYLANTITSVGGFVVVIILANTLSASDYGTYKYVFSVIGILSVLSLIGGFRNTVIQSAAQCYDGVVSRLFKLNLLLSLPMLVGGLVVGIYYLIQNNNFLGYGIFIATVCSIVGNNGLIVYGYLNGRKSYKLLCTLQGLQSLITIILLIIITSITSSLLTVFLSLVLSTALVVTIFLFYVKRKMVRNNETDSKVLHYGKHLNILGAITAVMVNIDSVLIFKFIGAESLALYALATPFVDRLIGFLKATYYFALPKYSSQNLQTVYLKLYKRSFLMLLFGISLYGTYFIVSPFVFQLFFPKYFDSIQLSQLFAINIPIIAFSILPDAFLDSIMEVRNKYIVKGIVTTTRIVTMLILIFPYGIAGVIWSEIIARTVGAASTIFLIKKYVRNSVNITGITNMSAGNS